MLTNNLEGVNWRPYNLLLAIIKFIDTINNKNIFKWTIAAIVQFQSC